MEIREEEGGEGESRERREEGREREKKKRKEDFDEGVDDGGQQRGERGKEE